MIDLNPFPGLTEDSINEEIRKVRASDLSPDQKGTQLNRLYEFRTRQFGSKERKNSFERRQGQGGKK